MSDRALIQLEKDNQGLRARLKRAATENEGAMKQGVYAATAMTSAFGLSYIQARYPDKAQFASIPLSLVVGGVLTGIGAFGYAGTQSDIVGMGGLGALCAYAGSRGTETGTDAKNKAK